MNPLTNRCTSGAILFKYVSVLVLMASAVLGGEALTCVAMRAQQKPQLEAFISSWYKVPIGQTIALIDSSTVDSACYRKLVFRASVPSPLLTLYLTPDAQHLVSNVMDLNVDPALARRKKQEEFQVQLTSGGLLILGASTAPLTMVIFSDFQCPYCKKFTSFLGELTPNERSKLRITYRQLPLNIHSWAQDAAALGVCVARQDKAAFWKLHDFLFSNQQELSKETLTPKVLDFLSQNMTIDPAKVTSCLKEKAFQDSLQRDQQLAIDLGIKGTPTVFLNGRRISVRSTGDLRKAMQAAEAENVAITQLKTH